MIRMATKQDINSIYELGQLVNKNFKKVYDLETMLQEKYNKIYVAVIDEKVVGFLMVIVLYESCEILNIAVLEKYQKKGIASNMLDFMISEFDNSIDIVTLEVSVDNTKAINLYKKFGFEIINTRKNYYGDKDAYLMGVKYERC
jgi:ribosomal-protein-alanine N-acetyltransferase